MNMTNRLCYAVLGAFIALALSLLSNEAHAQTLKFFTEPLEEEEETETTPDSSEEVVDTRISVFADGTVKSVITGEGDDASELFQKIMDHPEGLYLCDTLYEDNLKNLKTNDGKIFRNSHSGVTRSFVDAHGHFVVTTKHRCRRFIHFKQRIATLNARFERVTTSQQITLFNV